MADLNSPLLDLTYEELSIKYHENKIRDEDLILGTSPFFRSLRMFSKLNKEEIPGCVYLIENEDGKVKVGKSINPKIRIKYLLTQGCIEMKRCFISESTINYYNIETQMHNIFNERKIKGEWFDVSFDVLKEKLLEIYY